MNVNMCVPCERQGQTLVETMSMSREAMSMTIDDKFSKKDFGLRFYCGMVMPCSKAWSDDGQVVRSSSGDSQVGVKSQRYSELDIGGRETSHHYQEQGSRE